MSSVSLSRDEFQKCCKSIHLLSGVNASCTALKAEFQHKNQGWVIQTTMKGGKNLVCAKNKGCNYVAYYSTTRDTLNVQLLASKYSIGPKIEEVWRCVDTNDAVVISQLVDGSDLATYIKNNLNHVTILSRLVISVYFMIKVLHNLGYVLGNADQLDKIIGNYKDPKTRGFRVFITDFSSTRQSKDHALLQNDYTMFYNAVSKLTGGDELAQHIVQYAHQAITKTELKVVKKPEPISPEKKEEIKQKIKQEIVQQEPLLLEYTPPSRQELEYTPPSRQELEYTPPSRQELEYTPRQELPIYNIPGLEHQLQEQEDNELRELQNERIREEQDEQKVSQPSSGGILNMIGNVAGSVVGGAVNVAGSVLGAISSAVLPSSSKPSVSEQQPSGIKLEEEDVFYEINESKNEVPQQVEAPSTLSGFEQFLVHARENGYSFNDVMKRLPFDISNSEITYISSRATKNKVKNIHELFANLNSINLQKVQLPIYVFMLYAYTQTDTIPALIDRISALYQLFKPDTNVYTANTLVTLNCEDGDLICGSQNPYCSKVGRKYSKCVPESDLNQDDMARLEDHPERYNKRFIPSRREIPQPQPQPELRRGDRIRNKPKY